MGGLTMNEQAAVINGNDIPPMDPHVLYNTLDTINWMALEREEYTISRMLTSLSAMLRYTIHDRKEQITVREETEYLRKFIYLQQQRFGETFSCKIKEEEKSGNCKMPRCLIQPILEQLLDMGFSCEEYAEIEICFSLDQQENLRIKIQDNGIRQINPKTLEEIRLRIVSQYESNGKMEIGTGEWERIIWIQIPLEI